MKTHWKKQFNNEYIGAWSMEQGKDLILTIESVSVEVVTGPNNRKEDCPVIRFKEDVLPMVLNRTNAKTIEKIHGTPFIEDWAGCKVQLYVANGIKAFGDVVDALRVRDFKPKDESIDVTAYVDTIEAFGDLNELKTYFQSLPKEIMSHKLVSGAAKRIKELLTNETETK